MTVEVRLLRPDEAEAGRDVAQAALSTQLLAGGGDPPPVTPASRERGVARVAHLQRTDPDGCWIALDDGQPVGVALALRRGPLWFLSLLGVLPGRQGQGVGRLLLDGALTTADDLAMIMSSDDPKALRRYGSAGFALHPGYTVDGELDRALLPAVPGVREGDADRDADLVDRLATSLRGAPYGPDVARFVTHGHRLLVLPDRGFAVLRPGMVCCLGATDEEAATRLLWAALAEAATPRVMVELVTAPQQWAVRTALAGRLPLRPDGSLCVRGGAAPSPLHLPGGMYG